MIPAYKVTSQNINSYLFIFLFSNNQAFLLQKHHFGLSISCCLLKFNHLTPTFDTLSFGGHLVDL